MDPLDKECSLKLARYRRRLQMMLRALYNIVGSAMRTAFVTQQRLLQVIFRNKMIVYDNEIDFLETIL